MAEQPSFNDRLLAALAYFFAVPSLYIVLTKRKKDPYLGYHGQQALFLWFVIILIWLILRLFLNFIENLYYSDYFVQIIIALNWGMWIYAIWSGIRSAQGERFEIKYISKFVR